MSQSREDKTYEINNAFLKIRKRAESENPAKLVSTFVDVGPLFSLLANPDHQIIYGRRGTGKTHAMVYLGERVKEDNNLPIYVDMRMLGSTKGMHSDESLSFSERATRLLSDTLAELHDEILEYAIDHDEVNLTQIGSLLDQLAEGITDVRVVGDVEREVVFEEKESETDTVSAKLEAGSKGLKGSVGAENNESEFTARTERQKESGRIMHRLHFGQVGNAIRKIVEALPNERIWLLLDEWSSVPLDLQPFLADLLRRTVFPIRNLTVKIAAIEQRSVFQLLGEGGEYTGIEVGADAAANLDLDDFMVFGNDRERATDFFRRLVYKHYASVIPENSFGLPGSPTELSRDSFTQENTFEEFVRSAEGVPRDAINVLALAAQKNMRSQISVDRIRSAARTWYQRVKEDAISSNDAALSLLRWIIDEVIKHRKARAFLLESTTNDGLINTLFDARAIHLLKKNISAHDEPGVRYNAFKLDYGCYVHLANTSNSPQFTLFEGEGESVEVPADDYRAIRRAILDIDDFRKVRANQTV